MINRAMSRKNLHFALAVAALGSALAVSACNYRVDHQNTPNADPVAASTFPYGFATVYTKVIDKKCAGCHEELTSYPGVKAKLAAIESQVSSKRMPKPPRSLSSEEESLLLGWIRAGAPETGTEDASKPQQPGPVPTATPDAQQPAPAPTATPDPQPGTQPGTSPAPTATPTPAPALEATYTSIRAQIFEPKCLKCHSEFGSAEDVPLDTLSGLLQVPDLINRTHPEASLLIKAVSKTGRGRMPPERTGLPPLTPEEISILTEWIRLGTPE